jgi:hypothetical protein
VCKCDDFLQDEDFVLDKDDGGSPTDDSGEEESDASESGEEKEANHFFFFILFVQFLRRLSLDFILLLTSNEFQISEARQKGIQKRDIFQGIFF